MSACSALSRPPDLAQKTAGSSGLPWAALAKSLTFCSSTLRTCASFCMSWPQSASAGPAVASAKPVAKIILPRLTFRGTPSTAESNPTQIPEENGESAAAGPLFARCPGGFRAPAARSLCPFAARDHRPHEVFPVLDAGQNDSRHVRESQPDQRVCGGLVHAFQGLGAPVGVSRKHEAGRRDEGDQREHGDDHRASGRIMAKIAGGF